jgi:hypothetical protein
VRKYFEIVEEAVLKYLLLQKVELAHQLYLPHSAYSKSQVVRALGIARGTFSRRGKQALKDKSVAHSSATSNCLQELSDTTYECCETCQA